MFIRQINKFNKLFGDIYIDEIIIKGINSNVISFSIYADDLQKVMEIAYTNKCSAHVSTHPRPKMVAENIVRVQLTIN